MKLNYKALLPILLILPLLLACALPQSGSASPPPDTIIEPGQPFTMDFPRLGMWWPSPWEQPLQDIARYDWVILSNDAEEFIAPLRELNPDITLLNSTNACEIGYDPDPDAEPGINDLAQQVPPEWFLTQVGTNLAEAVDATTTKLHVNATTITGDEETYTLFEPGDTAIIDSEIVYIEAVDRASNILTVERGYIRPAATHTAGTRIAALISFWPQSWLMNVSTYCPKAVLDSAAGPETWTQANARRAVEMLQGTDWDGILIDRSDKDESWLIGNSTARTIDADRSNRLPSDYTDFDRAWNQGLRAYEAHMRQQLGPDKIIFANWGMENFDLLNGNNFETFPPAPDNYPQYGNSFTMQWVSLVFGPDEQHGSYFEWMEKSRQPNLTMIETYEDDDAADPLGDGEYLNPCDDPDFVPDYRKMRFGLATTLLNDGFYSYEINTNGHGTLCLLWFDEYDNAGAGRGYLGQPLGPAQNVAPANTTPNLLSDSTFEEDEGEWGAWADAGNSVSAILDNTTAAEGETSLRLDITQADGTFWAVTASVPNVEVISGSEYSLSFWAKADSERELPAWLQQPVSPWEDLGTFNPISLTTEWTHYQVPGLAIAGDANGEFYFGLGNAAGTVWLDDVQLYAGAREVWRRDYDNGIVLANATGVAQTITLNDVYEKINGTQDPAINDGQTVNQVTLPPYDGLILLRSRDTQSFYLPMVIKNRAS